MTMRHMLQVLNYLPVMSKRTSLPIEEETKKKIKALAALRGWSLGCIVNTALKEYLERHA